jgi:Tfp pilus assembly protein PilZ
LKTQTAKAHRSLRVPFVRRCSLTIGDQEHEALLIDLSVAGIYVQTNASIGEGDEAVIKFRVPGNDRLLEIETVVVYVNHDQKHPVHSLPPGAGLRFRNLSVEDSKLVVGAILAYCRSNPVYRQYL